MFIDVTGFSLPGHLSAFHAEPAIGLPTWWTVSKYRGRVEMVQCPEEGHFKVGLQLQWLIKCSDYGYGKCSELPHGLFKIPSLSIIEKLQSPLSFLPMTCWLCHPSSHCVYTCTHTHMVVSVGLRVIEQLVTQRPNSRDCWTFNPTTS